jgi:hypothetical protein
MYFSDFHTFCNVAWRYVKLSGIYAEFKMTKPMNIKEIGPNKSFIDNDNQL